MLKHRFLGAATFAQHVEAAEKNQDLLVAIRKRARVPDELLQRARSLPGRWHLLVLSEDWCGDAVNTVPVLAALADACDNLDLRVLERDENLDLMDAHLSPTGARAIPVVMLLDEHFQERAWWGSRPAELQQWMLAVGKQLPPEERYREVRRWYARDQGRTTLEEVVSLLEEAARKRRAAVA